MKAIRVYEYGNPEVLQLEEVADPVAGEGEVLIEVAGQGSTRSTGRCFPGR